MKLTVVLVFFVCGLIGHVVGAEVILTEGECWSYDTRHGEEDSFIVIRRIETVPQFGEVVHVSIYALKVKSALSPTGITPSILLQPFSAAPLRSSLKQRINREIPPDQWEFAFQSLREKYQGHQLIPV